MFALVIAFLFFFSFLSSVLAGLTAIPHGVKNPETLPPRTAGFASGVVDRSVYTSASKLQLFPIAVPTASANGSKSYQASPSSSTLGFASRSVEPGSVLGTTMVMAVTLGASRDLALSSTTTTLESSSFMGTSVLGVEAAFIPVVASTTSPPLDPWLARLFNAATSNSWPTRVFKAPAEIMPLQTMGTVPCDLGPHDVDCEKFASIVVWFKTLSTTSMPDFKTVATSKLMEHLVTEIPNFKPTSTPAPSVSQDRPVNVTAPLPILPSSAVLVASELIQVQDALSSPAKTVSLTSSMYGPPSLDLPPPCSKEEAPSVLPSAVHEDKTMLSSPLVASDVSSDVSSVTVVPISPWPSRTRVTAIDPLPSVTGVGTVPTSSLPSGPGSITPSASLISASTLATASAPKSSSYDPNNRDQPIYFYGAAAAKFPSPWLCFIVSFFTGVRVMV